MITAIVLAGGRSSRFGSDKLAADLDGRSVLAVTLDAVAPIVDGIVVAGPRLPEGWSKEEVPVALLPDAAAFEGPLAALANVLASAVSPRPTDLAIVVGGDMPSLVPAVLGAMIEILDIDPTIDAVHLGRPKAERGESRRQVLPLALRLDPAVRVSREAVADGERSLHAFVDRLAHVELAAERWLPLDPAAATLIDVDTRADLDQYH